MAREQVLAVLEGGAPWALGAGYELGAGLRAVTPEEPATEADDDELARWNELADRLGEHLAARRVFTEADVAALSAGDLEALQAIGYAD